MTPSQLIPTLSGREYSSDEVYDRERSQIFHRSWFYVCRDERLAPGDRFVADVAGESVLVVKDRDGRVHAHATSAGIAVHDCARRAGPARRPASPARITRGRIRWRVD